MAGEILINKLFAGKYLDEGENIGHEVINLFKDDDGYNNLFITPNGNVHDHEIESIIFVRNTSAGRTVEVIGRADKIYSISTEEMQQIKYGGVLIDQIFKNNTYRGEIDTFSEHVTFRAGSFRLPSRRVFITIDDDFSPDEYVIRLDSNRKVIIPQGMRMYYSEDKDSNAYRQLKDFLLSDDLWEKDNTTEKLFVDGNAQNVAPSFLEVIRKEDDENIFSNLLGYYFEYSRYSFQKFAADLLDIPNMSIFFTILRETMNRIDLWIESEKDIIVIENKIKSGINGISSDDYSQLNKYYETAEKEAKIQGKQTHYYIFAPNYAKLDLTPYGMKDIYKIIRYGDIYDFFIRESATYIADRAFPDFVRGLKRHTLSLAEFQFDTMRSRLLRKINQLH